MDFFFQLLASGLISGSVYSLMALGIVIIYKASSVFNFAHGAIVALAGYLFWSFLVQMHLSPVIAGLLLLASIGLMSWLIQRLILQPLAGQPVLAAIIATLALSELVAGLIILLWPGPGRLYRKLMPSATVKIGTVVLSSEGIINFFICALSLILFLLFFQKSRLGLAMRGTAEDHILARSEGVKVTQIFVLAWFVAMLMASVGGILMANIHGVNMEPLMNLGMKSLVVVMVGGMESIPGALVGGLTIGTLEALGAGYLDPLVGGGTGEIFPFIILVLVLLIKPYGLFGYPKIERV